MTDNKRFTDNGNSTITDMKMKIIWKKTDSFQDTKKWQNWFKCQDYTEITNIQQFAGSEEWRYPNEEEAWSLFDLGNKNTDKYGDETLPIYGDTQMRKRHGVCLTLATKTLINMAMKFISIQYLDQDPVEQHGPVKRKIRQLLSYNTKMA